jgi:formate dehydrogenase subunit gamma
VSRVGRFPRFDRLERAVHWSNATLFFVLIATGASLKVGSLSTIVANRALVKNIHVYVGLLLPVPLLLGILVPAGRQLRRDLSRLNRWTRDDRRWWSPRLRHDAQLGKFNPGQKLNAVFTGAAIVVMLMTGAIMRWPEPFSDSWRTGATFVHDSTWLVLMIVITGHIVIALRDFDSMRSMIRGWVPEAWARRERPQWWAEILAARTARAERAASAGAVGDVAAGGEQGFGEAGASAGEVSVGDGVEARTGDGLGGRDL